MRIEKVLAGRTPGLAYVLTETLQRGFAPVPRTQSGRPFPASLPTTSHVTRLVQEVEGSQVSLSTHLS